MFQKTVAAILIAIILVQPSVWAENTGTMAFLNHNISSSQKNYLAKVEEFQNFVNQMKHTATEQVEARADELFEGLEEARYQAFKNFCFTLERAKVMSADFSAIIESHINKLTSESRRISFMIERYRQRLAELVGFPQVDSDENVHVLFKSSHEDMLKMNGFLRQNISDKGMPISYKVPKGYWQKAQETSDPVDGVLERILMQYGLSVYDAAVWMTALISLEGERDIPLIDQYHQCLIEGSIGEMTDIRAYKDPFRYGDKKVRMPRDNAFFFRMISDKYIQADPKDGKEEIDNFPNFKKIHHEDWKPIMGEQAWAAIIGPLQVAYYKYKGDIPLDCPEVKLALSILPALEAMQNDIGAVYHAPSGTHGKSEFDISNENNFSLLSALKMLHQVLEKKDPQTDKRIVAMMERIYQYFEDYAYDEKMGVMLQGGHYINKRFIPTKVFAVDCQTWGMIVLTPEWVDRTWGDGTAYKIWKKTKKRGGYYDKNPKIIKGVGFTDGHQVLSSEWTAGAIWCARMISDYYKESHPEWSKEAWVDAVRMRRAMETLRDEPFEGTLGYKYANKRSFIPFGWWANPAPCIVGTSWLILIDQDFNPFELGGGKKQQSKYYKFR